jgi:hypothetical protein
MNSERIIWKDSAIVIVITLVVASLSSPFEKTLPILLQVIANHYASIVGYLFLCYLSKKVEVWHLGKVSLIVWAIFAVINTIMYWDLIGTKYTLKGIVFGGLLTELISVVLGGLTYFIYITIRNTIAVKCIRPKPKWLKETTFLMGVFNIGGLIFFDTNSKYLSIEIFLFTLLIPISYLVLWGGIPGTPYLITP